MPATAALAIPRLEVLTPNQANISQTTSPKSPWFPSSPTFSLKGPIDLRRPLVVSPYTSAPHLIDLRTLSEQVECQALAIALQDLKTVTSQYTDISEYPPSKAFNWATIHTRFYQALQQLRLSQEEPQTHLDLNNEGTNPTRQTRQVLKAHTFHVITFHSSLLPSADRDRLGDLDEAAHAEALSITGGALIKYWFGDNPDSQRRNVAMCIWRSREDSLLAAGPKSGQPHSSSGPRSRHGSPSVSTPSSRTSSQTPSGSRPDTPVVGSAHLRAKMAVPVMYAKILISEWKLRVEWYEEEEVRSENGIDGNADANSDADKRRVGAKDSKDVPDLVAFTRLPKEDQSLPDWKLELVQSRNIL